MYTPFSTAKDLLSLSGSGKGSSSSSNGASCGESETSGGSVATGSGLCTASVCDVGLAIGPVPEGKRAGAENVYSRQHGSHTCQVQRCVLGSRPDSATARTRHKFASTLLGRTYLRKVVHALNQFTAAVPLSAPVESQCHAAPYSAHAQTSQRCGSRLGLQNVLRQCVYSEAAIGTTSSAAFPTIHPISHKPGRSSAPPLLMLLRLQACRDQRK